MSERYGSCRSCNGSGKKSWPLGSGKPRADKIDPAQEPLTGEQRAELASWGADSPHQVVKVTQYVIVFDCGTCDGTGQSGDIQDYSG